MRFDSSFSGGFIIARVVNPPEKRLGKYTFLLNIIPKSSEKNIFNRKKGPSFTKLQKNVDAANL